MINHCDRHITLYTIDTDLSFGQFNLFTYLDMPLGDSKEHSKCKRNFEDIFNRAKDISKSLR